MPYQEIITEERGRVGIITLNRTHKLNSLGKPMTVELRQALEAYNQDPNIGAIVLTGAGRAFCAGADFGRWDADLEARERGQEEEGWSELEDWVYLVQRSKPIVCAINGFALGAGLTVILPCDVRIASEQARLSMRFVRVGVIPELASTRLLVNIVGLTHALELMLSGKIIDAQEAGRIGLVNRVVPHDRLLEEAVETAAEIAFNADDVVALIKKAAWANLFATDIGEVMRREGEAYAAAIEGPAFQEAVQAFLEKREPQFHRV